MDLLLYNFARERARADSPISLQSEVKREGVLLFEREEWLCRRISCCVPRLMMN